MRIEAATIPLLAVLILAAPEASAAPAAAVAAAVPLAARTPPAEERGVDAHPSHDRSWGRIPLAFEANRGQAHADVRFLARARGYTLFLTDREAVFVVAAPDRRRGVAARARPSAPATRPAVVRVQLVDGLVSRPDGREALAGRSNYLIGKDPARWVTDVATYAGVRYMRVYPGVDAVYRSDGGEVALDFVVAPGADPGAIRLAFDGADRIEIDAAGHLRVTTRAGQLRLGRPTIYQEVDGARRLVDGGFRARPPPDRDGEPGRPEVGFHVGAYDRARALVIDPTVAYSTLIGGEANEYPGGETFSGGNAIAVDSSGHAYVVGYTQSFQFPTTAGAFMPDLPNDSSAAFVVKVNPTGTGLVYATYLGGAEGFSTYTQAHAVTVDSSGNAYVGGSTEAEDFPTTPGAFQRTLRSGFAPQGFITKLDPTGSSLVFSTYLGGGCCLDEVTAIAIDATRNVYVAGLTGGTGFPTTPGAFQRVSPGNHDYFVTKLNPTGSALVYSTFLGGSDDEGFGTGDEDPDGVIALAVDAAGSAHVAAATLSRDFPTTPGAFQRTHAGDQDVFVSKLSPSGGSLVYSTFLGGRGLDFSLGLTLDGSGNAYTFGFTRSRDFPTIRPLQVRPPDLIEANRTNFVARFSPSGQPVYSTLLGGSGTGISDFGVPRGGIAVDAAGNVYVGGGTDSANFPVTAGSLQTTFGGGGSDGFLFKLDFTGTVVLDSTFFGGRHTDNIRAITVDAAGDVYVAGYTFSTNFPTTPGAFQRSLFNTSGHDVFVAKFRFATATPLQFVNFPADFPSLPPEGQVGVPYAGNLGVGGGVPPHEVTIVSGALPAGLRLGSPTVTGTPTTAQEARFTALVRSADNIAGVLRDFQVVIRDGAGGSGQALASFVRGLYETILERGPSAEEVAGWSDYLRANPNNAGASGIIHTFFDGPEYASRAVTPASHVGLLYTLLLGRAPEPAGLEGWTRDLLARFDPVLLGFIGSAEFQARVANASGRSAVEALVTRFYQIVLERTPAAAEVAAWADYVLATRDFQGLAAAFFHSAEYNSRSRTLATHVTLLYRTFLDRDPEPGATGPWVNDLVLRRGSMADSFITSPEFQQKFQALF